MNELTVTTNEIRQLRAICRAKDEEVKAWLRKTVAEARYSHHRVLEERRKITPNHAQYYAQERERFLYAARIMKSILVNVGG